jgi:GNAT superfamily N-acetyltransferase
MLESAIRATYSSIARPAVFEAVIAHTCTPEAIAAAIESASASELGHFLMAEPVPLGFIDFGEDGDGLELRRLYTAVGETGRGVGTLLLAALEEALPTGTEYRAIVHKDNRRALTFWKRHGFTEVGLVDTRDHFAAHRAVGFADNQEPDHSLLLRRVGGG